MRGSRVMVPIVWGLCSTLVAACFTYLGAGTEPFQDRWPFAGLTGAVLGVGCGIAAVRSWGDRWGLLLTGVLGGILLGVGASSLVAYLPGPRGQVPSGVQYRPPATTLRR